MSRMLKKPKTARAATKGTSPEGSRAGAAFASVMPALTGVGVVVLFILAFVAALWVLTFIVRMVAALAGAGA